MNSAHSKDELCSFKTVGVVTSGRSKMAVILYIYIEYRYRLQQIRLQGAACIKADSTQCSQYLK